VEKGVEKVWQKEMDMAKEIIMTHQEIMINGVHYILKGFGDIEPTRSGMEGKCVFFDRDSGGFGTGGGNNKNGCKITLYNWRRL
jgi:hypothetical protein